MHSLTPRFILERLADGQHRGQFAAIVLFVDTSGFTPLTSQLMAHGAEGAEVLADILLSVFGPLIQSVYEQGGFIAGFAGDAFKAIFPLEQPDAPLRALAAAQQIRRHLAAHPSHPTPYGDFDFAVRTSMADDLVDWAIWSHTGSAPVTQSHVYSFFGPAIDQAVQGDALAEAGDMVITRAVADRLRAQWPGVLATDAIVAQGTEIGDYLRVQVLSGPLPAPQPLADPAPLAGADRFFPADLLEATTQGEFRRVVSVFLSIQELSAPHTADTVMPLFFRLLHQYGGYLCRVGRVGASDRGNTFLLFWGAPTSHENDLQRALDFLLELRDQVGLPMRVGVTSGVGYAGFIGAPNREEYTCYGISVNLAARQMVRAGWGEIWLDAETARFASGFTVTQGGAYRFKGFDADQSVFILRGRSEQMETTAYQHAMIGRGQELAQLRAAAQPLLAGRCGGMVIVVGEAGIGKSRLLYELRQQLTAPDAPAPIQWFHCPADEILRRSLNPFRHLLRNYFRQTRTQTESVNRTQFDRSFNALVDQTSDELLRHELVRTRPFLAALVDLFWSDSIYFQVDPALRFENTVRALKTFFLAESRRQPLAIEIEDLHWLDGDSQHFLHRLLRDTAAEPFMVIATSREAPAVGSFADAVQPQQITLGPLGPGAMEQLAEQRLARPAAPALIELLQTQSEGNPFFAEQILLYLQEQGQLIETVAGAAPAATAMQLPAAVQTILVARLDRLAQVVKEVVQTAAVLGREFEVQVLSHMLSDADAAPSHFNDNLKSAEGEAIWSALSELRYLFRHTLLREAAYEMQLRARLRSLHRLAGDSIAEVYQADLAPHYAELAHHYHQADAPELERCYARLAGERAAEQFSNDKAIAHLGRALELTPINDVIGRFELLATRLRVLQVQGDRAAQEADLQMMAALADALADPIRQAAAALARAEFAENTSDYPAAIAAAESALAFADVADDDLRRVQAHQHLGRALWRQGQYQAAEPHIDTALQLARSHNWREQEADALVILGILRWFMGDYEQAQAFYEQTLPIYAEIGKPLFQGPVLQNLGLIQQSRGDHTGALVNLQRALALYQEMGDRLRQAIALSNLGISYQRMGDYLRATNTQQQALRLFHELSDRFGMMIAHANLGAIALEFDDFGEARREFTTALDYCRAIGSRGYDSLALAILAEIDLEEGMVDQVYERIQAALTIAQEVGHRDNQGKILLKLGRAAYRLGRFADARAAYEEALTIRRALGQATQAMEVLAGLADVALAEGDVAGALAQVDVILPALADGGLEALTTPYQIDHTCFTVLRAANDGRAGAVLADAVNRLYARAALMEDAELRHKYLHQVAAHRALLAAYYFLDNPVV
ncbi:MAG: tetratricopeptide repeat protein [Caldilineaceae bacterium]|nr:tetratricopeptide repeat protein [Caldilineaceae bacterium]